VIGGLAPLIPLVIVGRSPVAGQEIAVQILTDTSDFASWTTLATTTSSDVSNGDAELAYDWSISIAPSSRPLDSWANGGLFRLRVLSDGERVAVLSHDADACMASQSDDPLACASMKNNGVVLVNPSQGNEDFPPYLARKGQGSLTDTQLYYLQTDAPATYEEFMTRYIDNGTNPASAVYSNIGDLDVGRNIECAQFADGDLIGLACMTGNFGAFSGDPGENLNAALTGFEAGDGLGAFAYVAMVYQPSRGLENTVSFVVFGPDGARVDEAALDTQGDVVAVPNTCLNCHGSGSSFNAETGIVLGASFLPFDTLQLDFSPNVDYSLPTQLEELRKLNALISETALNDATQGMIDGMYPGGVDQPGSLIYPGETPLAWSTDIRAAETYRHVIAPFCRGCHMTGPRDFTTEELFRTTGAESVAQVCQTHEMPNAEVVTRNFWAGPARAYLVDFFDVATPCTPPL
jgi:hypothetical protein